MLFTVFNFGRIEFRRHPDIFLDEIFLKIKQIRADDRRKIYKTRIRHTKDELTFVKGNRLGYVANDIKRAI